MINKLKKIPFLIDTLKLKDSDINDFVDWYNSQNQIEKKRVLVEDFKHPKNKELFDLANVTGVLHLAYSLDCPFCKNNISVYTKEDIKNLPQKSFCHNCKSVLDTFSPKYNTEYYYFLRIISNIYY